MRSGSVGTLGVTGLCLLSLACVGLPGARHSEPIVPAAREEAAPDPGGIVSRSAARGSKPLGALMRARQHRDEMLEHHAGPAGIVSSSWKLLGPPSTGGRVRAILIHPVLDNAMLVGAATGGVWRTLDDGHHWVPSDDFMASLTIGCMAMDPITPTTVYAGTGEGFFRSKQGSTNSAAIQGEGIFKSIDFGVAWFQLPSTATTDFQFVNRISIASSTSNAMLAATGTGIFRSTDHGNTWNQVHVGTTYDVKFHPTDSTRAVAGEDHDGTALYSSDGGQTWQAAVGAPIGARRIELAWARSAPDTVYAASLEEDDLYVSVSTDFGETYARVTNQPGLDAFGEYAMTLWVDPLDAERLLMGGRFLYASTDGGVSFDQIDTGHDDHHVLIEHPNYGDAGNKVVFNGSDGGVYRYDDPFADPPTIENLNDTLVITQFYGADIHPSGAIVGGTQDYGTWAYDPQSQQWSSIHGADGGHPAIEPLDPDVLYYQEQGLEVFRSDDSGVSESLIFSSDSANEPANFVAPLERGPLPNVDRVYIGGLSLWRTSNPQGDTVVWGELKEPSPDCPPPAPPPPPTESEQPPGHTLDAPDCNISAISVSPLDTGRIWVCHNNGEVWATTTGNSFPTWVRLDDNNGPLPDRWCSDIVADPHDANRAYVSFMGYAADSVWKTDDFGASWINITGAGPTGLPELPVNALAVQPILAGWLYAATDLGIYSSQDDGATWSGDNVGPSNVSVDELVFKDIKSMMAVTHGRGLWIVDTFDDCNGNMILDKSDIISGFSKDLDLNGIPDECESGPPPGRADPTTGPILLGKDGGGVVIHCSASCSTGAIAYGVYEGTIGAWYSHKAVPDQCRATCPGTIRVTPTSAAAYYLVVPNTLRVEGSYGTAFDTAEIATERPRPAIATERCAEAQLITACP